MRFRFTLNNVPRLPALANWRTQAGSLDWTIDNSPSITLTESTGSDPGSVIEVDFVLTPGEYTFDYNVTINGSGSPNTTTFALVAYDDLVIVSDPLTGFKDPSFSSNGTFSGSLTLTVLQNSNVFAISVGNFSAFPKDITINNFTIQNAGNQQEISEPDGWKGAKITLERDDQFFSLIERYEGAAGGAFIFYGNNGEENGGIEYIQGVEENFGFDANIEFLAEFAPNDTDYQDIFEGLLDLSGKNEMTDNKMQVPVIRDDFWAKFISRMDTPVSMSDTVDLDGNPVSPVEPITINLTSQKLRQKYEGHHSEFTTISYTIPDNEYGQIDFEQETLLEIDEKFVLPRVENTSVPSWLFSLKYEGQHAFDIQIITSVGGLLSSSTDANLLVRLQINDDSPITLSKVNEGTNGLDGRTKHSYNASLYLNKNDVIRLYFFNNNAAGASYTFDWPANVFFDGSYLKITADTIFPTTQADGYLIHDLIYGVLQRIGLGLDPFYSDFLGSQFTNTKQYDEDGCGWMYVILKGLQIRQYTLTEKPFFISFKQIWDGINPILNLGLGYEVTEESPDHQVIRIEQKLHFVEDNISIYFSNVRDISSSYDQNMIFKTVKVGFKKWQSENTSGIDDPQTKHTYATRFEKVGKEINLESDFIAAGLAVETTRRATREKAADYKYDNDNFIIALNQDDISPDVYVPELDENFNSITGILNSDTRYNLILTPMRSLLRWANYLGGCLQSYLNSSYKFVSGEGNYDMATDYSCGSGNECQAILCDELSEKQNIPLGPPTNYNSVFDYFFLPLLYDITIPMEWEEYEQIRNNRKKSIGISQTDTGHIAFKVKLLEYDLVKGEANIKAWPKTFFRINVIDSTPEMECNVTVPDAGDFDVCYQAILDYGETI